MAIEYISGSDDFGFPVNKELEGPPTASDYFVFGCGFGGDSLIISRVPALRDTDAEDIRSFTGLGIRRSLVRGWREFNSSKIHTIQLRSDIKSVTELDKNMIDNRSGAAFLGVAGMALAGPVGILAGLAAKKKGEVVFAIEFNQKCNDPLMNEKVIVLRSTLQEYQAIKKISRAPSKSASEHISGGASDNEVLNDSISAEIQKLSNLKDSGAISEDEFRAAKAKLLGL